MKRVVHIVNCKSCRLRRTANGGGVCTDCLDEGKVKKEKTKTTIIHQLDVDKFDAAERMRNHFHVGRVACGGGYRILRKG